jgi:hypothetical protein
MERKVYTVQHHSNNCRRRDVKCFMVKIRKELKFIETTGIRKAMKEVPTKTQKAHRMDKVH